MRLSRLRRPGWYACGSNEEGKLYDATRGASTASCTSVPNRLMLRNTCSIACVCTSPPGVPNGIAILPGCIAIAGLGVSLGRLPGATPDGWLGSPQFWLPRGDGMMPSPGTTGAL